MLSLPAWFPASLRALLGDRAQVRSFEAAGGGRRWRDARSIDALNASVLAGAATVRRRARYQRANSPWAANGIAAIESNLIGTGIKPKSAHPDEKVRRAIDAEFEAWTDEADAEGRTDWYGLQRQAVGTMALDGESFHRLEIAPGARVPLKLRAIDADQVDMSLSRDLGGGARIVAGVEFDSTGGRHRYHVFPDRPGEPFAAVLTPVSVPAADVLHLFAPLAVGQVRGVSWLAPVLLRLKEIDEIEDAQLVRQRIAAMFTGFITDPNGESVGIEGERSGEKDEILEASLEPGSMTVLHPGEDVKFSNPPEIGDAVDFLKLALRGVAAGLGISYEQLTGDLAGVNYSSIRSGMVEIRRRAEALQHGVIVPQLCRPVWQRFIRLAVLAGRIPARDFDTNPAPYLAVKWIAPGWDWVDPLKDAQAEALAVKEGFKSRREVVAARGYDVEQIDAEIAADTKRADGLGLKLGAAAAAPAAPKEEAENASA